MPVHYDPNQPSLTFAAREIEGALNGSPGPDIHLAATLAEADRLAADLDLAPLRKRGPQSYALRLSPRRVVVLGADPTGAMYGGLEVAEAIRQDRLAQSDGVERAPFIERRGIKFNLPLDLRTPSYSDTGDAAQANIPEVWRFGFWREFLDEMARNRFNVLTLWNLHPFPSMVRVPEYPDVALDDVQRTTRPFDTSFSLRGLDMVRPDMLEQAEVVKRLGIDDKIAFWRAVMEYARDRGIEVYLFNWNLFAWGAEGKHGITGDQTDPVTLDYFRCSVRELVLTYPLLAGIGITAGENLAELPSPNGKEEWLWRAYGEGVRDALRREPGRRLRLIHRIHETNMDGIFRTWQDYPDTFEVSFKYAIAHMYSSPAPVFARRALAELPPGKRMWMTVRNDDFYHFRWGDPDYARAFVRHLPPAEQLAGFYMGPDGYVWGKDALSREPDPAWPLEIQRQWYTFRIWGWLSYDPDLPDGTFRNLLAARFAAAPADVLFQAGIAAARIIPAVNRFYWNDIDLKMMPEACCSHPTAKGFHRVDHVLAGQTMPGCGLLSIGEYCDAVQAGDEPATGTPPQVIQELRRLARTALDLVAGIDAAQTAELRRFLADWTALGHLGNYYAAKFAGALELAWFDRTGKPERQQGAIAVLEEALDHWRAYAAVVTAHYRPQFFTRIGLVDFVALTDQAAEDIRVVRDWRPRQGKTA